MAKRKSTPAWHSFPPCSLPGPNGWLPVNFSRNIMATRQHSATSPSAQISPKSFTPLRNPAAVIETAGDLFEAPENSLLLHACNCEGRWGAGIAGEMRQRYPAAFRIYKEHCQKASSNGWLSILGTTLLIQPQEKDIAIGKRHWIGCLFTKIEPGAPTKAFAEVDLLDATSMALKDLTSQLARLKEPSVTGGVFCPMLNAGIFRVPWPVTRQQLKNTELPITVFVPLEATDTQHPGVKVVKKFVDQVIAQRAELNRSAKARARLAKYTADDTEVRALTSISKPRSAVARILGSGTREIVRRQLSEKQGEIPTRKRPLSAGLATDDRKNNTKRVRGNDSHTRRSS